MKVLVRFTLLFTIILTPLFSQENSNFLDQAKEQEIVIDEDSTLAAADDKYDYMSQIFHMLYVLGIVIIGMLFLTWALKKFVTKRIKQVNDENLIKDLERRNLSPKSTLYLIESCSKRFLISDSANGPSFLTDVQTIEKTEVHEPNKEKSLLPKTSFSQILRRIGKEKKEASKVLTTK